MIIENKNTPPDITEYAFQELKISAINCEESSIHKELIMSPIHSLTSQQAKAFVLAAGFKKLEGGKDEKD